MIEIKALSKIFRQGNEDVAALSEVSLAIKKGECVIIGGPSGSGKTTFLNIVGGLTRPTRGEVLIDGKSLSRLPEHFLCELRRCTIGFIFQQFNLFSGYTALENVGMPLVPRGMGEKERRRRAAELLDSLGIADRADFPVNELSGGEQQRVAIARALINDPAIIIADEPISNVDDQNAARIAEIFARLNREGKTFLLTTHYGLLTELLPITSVFNLEKGKLI
jgi:putative ABC transport system ATP-binding protein